MKFFSLQRPSLRWVLLFSLMTHFFIAHHDGSLTLTLIQHGNQDIVLESGLSHAIAHHSAPEDSQLTGHHHRSEHEHQGLNLEHPEWYTFQASNLITDSLKGHLASVPIRLAAFTIFESFSQPRPVEARYFERYPPPQEREDMLSSTILLI